MYWIILCCCYTHTPPVNNVDWISHLLTCASILAPILFGLYQYKQTLKDKEKTRRKVAELKLLSEMHEACDGLLTSALAYNRHILAWLYNYQLYDKDIKDKEYNLAVCLKNLDLSEKDADMYNEYWSDLLKNIYALRVYLTDKEKADRILKLIEEPGGEFAKSFMDINWGETPDSIRKAHRIAYESIPNYVLKESKLKNVDEIRYIISGISKDEDEDSNNRKDNKST